jgi:hypothetical protein
MPKTTLEEKRLEALRRQLSGKPHLTLSTKKPDASSSSFELKAGSSSTQSSTLADISYLRKDLLKVLLLSFLAIALELSFFSLSNHHLLNLNFLHF